MDLKAYRKYAYSPEEIDPLRTKCLDEPDLVARMPSYGRLRTRTEDFADSDDTEVERDPTSDTSDLVIVEEDKQPEPGLEKQPLPRKFSGIVSTGNITAWEPESRHPKPPSPGILVKKDNSGAAGRRLMKEVTLVFGTNERKTSRSARSRRSRHEEEEVLEVLREVVRKCTSPEPSKRPTAVDIYNLLTSYL